MDRPDATVDISTVALTAEFPDIADFPGEFAALTTVLSPEGVRVDLALPGGEVRERRTSGRELLCTYAALADGESTPWCLGKGIATTDGDRFYAPGEPPLTGTAADGVRALGGLVADLFAALDEAGADTVPAVERCLGPGVDVDVAAIYDRLGGRQ